MDHPEAFLCQQTEGVSLAVLGGFAQVCAIGGEQYEGIRDDLPKIDRLQNRTNEDSVQVRKISGE